MEYLFLGLFFIFGLIFGSFFQVVGIRIPEKTSFVRGRSYCRNCKKQLQAHELIPLLSYILQKGKCRHCQKRISILYPFTEFVTGLLFAYSFYQFGFGWELLFTLFLMAMFVIIFITDVYHMVIPNKVLLFFFPVFILFRFLVPLKPWWSPLLGMVIAFFLLTLIIIISKGGMGGGDLKLFTLLGLVLGYQKVLLSFLLACLFGALIGVVFMSLGRLKRKEPMPFGPYIVLGAVITYFHGDFLIDWYLKIFLLA